MLNITVDRKRLAKYIKDNADTIARACAVDLNIIVAEEWGGNKQFVQFVEIRFDAIPTELVAEVQHD